MHDKSARYARRRRIQRAILRRMLQTAGLYDPGHRNAAEVELRLNDINSARVPAAFDGFRILQLSDLHVEGSTAAMARATELIADLDHDLCVITGDFRSGRYGAHDKAIEGVTSLCRTIKRPIYSVLGNHDTASIVDDLQGIGIENLHNRSVKISSPSGTEKLALAGIQFTYDIRPDKIEKAAAGISADTFSVLLAHTPDVYREAARIGFDVMLSGHTHGGQLCLPGGYPVTLNAAIPRHMGRGPWRHENLFGYTSAGIGTTILPVRFNCPPEVTLHTLRST